MKSKLKFLTKISSTFEALPVSVVVVPSKSPFEYLLANQIRAAMGATAAQGARAYTKSTTEGSDNYLSLGIGRYTFLFCDDADTEVDRLFM